jgi:hypothetical protein
MLAGSAGVEYITHGRLLARQQRHCYNFMSDTGIESDSVEDERSKRDGAPDEDVSLLV